MRVVLFFLIALIAAPARAEWVKFVENDNGVSYINPTTISKDGQFRRIWMIQDLKRRDENGEMSRRFLWENDCKEKRFRMLSFSAHSDPMAGGSVLASANPNDEWKRADPETSGKRLLDITCSTVTTPARSEWVKMAEGTDGRKDYLDVTTIRKDGQFRRAWGIQNLKERDEIGAMSVRILQEYDCKGDRFRMLSMSVHTEPMAGGNVLHSGNRKEEWSHVPPDTPIKHIFNVVCAK